MEYPAYPDAQPDVDIRRKNVVRRRGLPKQRIFFHHGEKYANNNVTLYDEKYNGRELRESTVRESEVYVINDSTLYDEREPTVSYRERNMFILASCVMVRNIMEEN